MEARMIVSESYPFLEFTIYAHGESLSGVAYVDSGFTGGLVISEDQWLTFGYPEAWDEYELGDGSRLQLALWTGTIRLNGHEVNASIVCTGDEYLIGREVIDSVEMRFSYGKRLTVQPPSSDSAIRPCITRLKPYRPGKPIDEVKRELGLTDVVKMASNENVLGPSPKAIEAMKQAAEEVWLYPDAECFHLKQALSQKFDYKPENFALGTGSDELLHLMALAYFNAGDEVVFAQPSFVVYESQVHVMDCVPRIVPLKNLTHDLAAMRAAVNEKTKAVFICNPNNPTGTYNTQADVEAFMKNLPDHVLVIFDEAYYEYVEATDYPRSLRYVDEGRNVIVLRTFSKIYALAGARIGYAIAHESIIANLNRVREPFNVNSIAQAGAIASLDDDEQVERTRRMNGEGKRYLYAEFEKLGLPYAPTEANFIFVDTQHNSQEVFQGLLRQGVIVRTGDIFGMSTFIRVTIGTREMNERFIAALRKVLGENP
jgi:histidinol-phosphate aminotransferase